jgi:hypothetical protein
MLGHQSGRPNGIIEHPLTRTLESERMVEVVKFIFCRHLRHAAVWPCTVPTFNFDYSEQADGETQIPKKNTS